MKYDHTLPSRILRSIVLPTAVAIALWMPSSLYAQNKLTVTNTADAGNGSLRQAILDANASIGSDDIEFAIPNSDPGFNGTWWTITLASALPTISSSGTRLLGSTQTAFGADPNSGVVGTGGTVGRAGLALPTLPLPEVAINGNGFDGLSLSGAASNIEIEGISIYGAKNGIVAKGAVTVGLAGENRRVHGVMVGPMPDGTAPGVFANSESGIVVEAATSAIDLVVLEVDSSYVGYNGQVGIVSLLGNSYLEVHSSEVFMNGSMSNAHDGIDVNGAGGIVSGNLSWGNTNASGVPTPGSGNGIEAGRQESPGTGNFEITNNTVMGNLGGGIGLRGGASYSLVRDNISTGNAVGIHVNEDGGGLTAQNRFQENSIFDNTGLGIDLHAGTSDDTFDGVTLNSPTSGTVGSNLLVPYPVITKAEVLDRVLTIEGFAQPGGLIELYESDDDESGFGEGMRFIIAFQEGEDGVDNDDTEGTYGPDLDGVMVSTEELTANKFSFSYGLGDEESEEMLLTATQSFVTSACLSCMQVMSTSEFGPNIKAERISGVANEQQEVPGLFKLHAAYPNPFNPATTISFDLEKSGPVTLKVYGADGTEHATLVQRTFNPGTYSFSWDARNMPSGLYFFRLDVGGKSAARSVLLTK